MIDTWLLLLFVLVVILGAMLLFGWGGGDDLMILGNLGSELFDGGFNSCEF